MIIQLTRALAKRGMEYIGLGKIWARITVDVTITASDNIINSAGELDKIVGTGGVLDKVISSAGELDKTVSTAGTV